MSKFLESLKKTAKDLGYEHLFEDLVPGTAPTSTLSPALSASDPDTNVDDYVENHPLVIKAKQQALTQHQQELAQQAAAAQKKLQQTHQRLQGSVSTAM